MLQFLLHVQFELVGCPVLESLAVLSEAYVS